MGHHLMGHLHELGASPTPRPPSEHHKPHLQGEPGGSYTRTCVCERQRIAMGKVGDFQAVMGSVIEEIPSDDKSWGKMGTSEVIR